MLNLPNPSIDGDSDKVHVHVVAGTPPYSTDTVQGPSNTEKKKMYKITPENDMLLIVSNSDKERLCSYIVVSYSTSIVCAVSGR